MPSLALKASVNSSFFFPTGGSYTPNYPSGLSGISGLLGWYDSSQVSSIVKDGSNNVSKWKNLFLGATQGGTHLDDFVIPSGSSSPKYLTNQTYYSGGVHNGISFDGTSSVMNLNSGFANLSLSDISYFWAYSNITSGGAIIDLADSQVSNMNDLATYYTAGLQPTRNDSEAQTFSGGTNQYAYQGPATSYGLFLTGGLLYVNGVLFHRDPSSQKGSTQPVWANRPSSSGFTSTTRYPLTYTNTDVGQTNQGASQAITGYGTFDPLDQFYLGVDVGNNIGSYGGGLIGEILVYGKKTNESETNSIVQYLQSKWA
jgi:hypothetical protein